MSQRRVKYLDLEVSFDAENIIIFAQLAVYIYMDAFDGSVSFSKFSTGGSIIFLLSLDCYFC